MISFFEIDPVLLKEKTKCEKLIKTSMKKHRRKLTLVFGSGELKVDSAPGI